MFLMMACGKWLRRILQKSIRGSTMSSANFVWPVHFARASTLRKGLPTIFNGCPFLPLPFLIIENEKLSALIRGLILFVPINAFARQFHLFPTHASCGELDGFID